MIEKLLDNKSFIETGTLVKRAFLTGGYGTIENRLVFIYEQTGYVTAAHARKISGIYESALKAGAPVIGILNSGGMSLEEGIEGLGAYAGIMKAMSKAKGLIPQISIITGGCMGAMSVIASLADFICECKGADFFIQSPNTLTGTKELSPTENPHIKCANEPDCISKVRELFRYLPSNYLDDSLSIQTDDLNRETPELCNIADEPDMRFIISALADEGKFLELNTDYATAVTALCNCGSHRIGIIANTGKLSASTLNKITGFLETCASLRLPLVTLTDVNGFSNSFAENKGLAELCAKWAKALVRASVPKINIITGNAVGSPYILMNSKELGADIVYSWPNTKMALLENSATVTGLDTGITTENAGESGQIDDIINPAETRQRIIAALEMLYGKRRI